MAEVVNSARLVFGNPDNGIISADGYNAEYFGKDFDSFISIDAIPGRHGAMDKSKLYYEKHSGAIMLKPILTLESMIDGVDYSTDGGSWEVARIPGVPTLDMLHQKDTTAEDWKVEGVDNKKISANEGFMVYWMKHLTPEGSSGDIVISLENTVGAGAEEKTSTIVKITISPRSAITIERKIVVSYTDAGKSVTKYGTEQKVEATIPQAYYETETFGMMKVLTCFFVDEYIVIGINGIYETIALKCENYTTITALDGGNNVKYTPQANDGGTLSFTASGSCLVGFKRLAYKTSGGFVTPIGKPGYILTESPHTEITKASVPNECGIGMRAADGGYDYSSEDVTVEGREGIEKCGFYGIITLYGPGNNSPLLYSFRLYAAPTRVSQAGTALNLTTDIKSYEETAAGDKDGNFMGSSIAADVICKIEDDKLTHTNLFRSKAPEVRPYLKLIGQETETLRGVHKIVTKVMGRPEWNKFELKLQCQDITERLRLYPVLTSENYDERGWTHVDLMKELGRNAGITVRCAGISADTTVPESYHYLKSSGDRERPNWQFGPADMTWNAMQRVREFSGWLLYPDNDPSNLGGLYYCPKPTSDSPVKYSLNADSSIVSNVEYRSIDLYRTRFLILGIAGRDSSADVEGNYAITRHRYKKGDILLGMGLHPNLEKEIGESRPLIWIDPTFTDWISIGAVILRLKNYYTKEHLAPVFQINNFRSYPNLYAYDLIQWTDDTKDFEENKLVDDKFLITSLRASVRRFASTAYINTTVTEQALLHGILRQAKQQSEVGMRDYNQIIKGMEAVTKGDYQELMTKAPAACRIFSYNDEDINDWGEPL